MSQKQHYVSELESGSDDSTVEILEDEEMELLFKQEVRAWLREFGQPLFNEAFAHCINVPQRKKVVAKRQDATVGDMDDEKKPKGDVVKTKKSKSNTNK